MWNCHQCGAENGDTSEFCASCGSRRAANAAGAATPPPPVTSRPAWSIAYNERSCKEARQLEVWGQVVFIAGLVLAVIVFFGAVVSGCAATDEVPRSMQGQVMLSAFFGGTLGGVGCALSGFLFRLVLRAFSIITEAHYRKLRDR